MSYLHDLAKSGHLAQREQPGDRPQGYRPVRSSWIRGSQGIQIDKLVWLAAMCCAVLLLFAPLSPRATWVHVGADVRGEASSIATGRAWAIFVGALGVAAICGLTIGAIARHKVIIPSLCAAVSTVAFGLAALNARFELSNQGAWSAALPNIMLYSTGWADTFGIIALVATVSAIGLTLRWLQPAQDDWS